MPISAIPTAASLGPTSNGDNFDVVDGYISLLSEEYFDEEFSASRPIPAPQNGIKHLIHSIPPEVVAIIFEFLDLDTLRCFAKVNYFAYCQVITFFNSKILSILSSAPALKLSKNDQSIKPEIESFSIFQPGLFFQLDKIYLRKKSVPLSTKLSLEQSFLIEWFSKKMVSSPHLRGNLLEAAKLFAHKNIKTTYITTKQSLEKEIVYPKMTIQNIKNMGFLDHKKMPAIVWSDSSESAQENCLPSTVIHPVHAAYFYKKFFTLCTQDQKPDAEAFLKIPPQYIINKMLNYRWNLNSTYILNDILDSNFFCHEEIYDEINRVITNPMHFDHFDESFFTLLVKLKFDINTPDANGLSPLDKMLLIKNYTGAYFFIKNGATIDWNKKYLDDLLCIAIFNKNTAIVNTALEKGANPHKNVPIFNVPITPFQYGLNCNTNLEIMQLLVNYGANVNVLNSSNETPLDIATARNCIEIVDFLEKNGALSGSDYRLLPARIWLAFKTHILSEIRGIASGINLCSIILMAICGFIEACNIYIYISLLIIFSLSGLILVIPPIYSFLYTAIYKKIFPTTE